MTLSRFQRGQPRGYPRFLVTPETATAWLEDNFQTPPKPGKILQYARQIREGTFPETDIQPIRFNRNGLLHDGQHRLFAVALFGVPYRFDVHTGQEG
jgi:hypothetical protein